MPCAVSIFPPISTGSSRDMGRVHRILDATHGSPDSEWFVLALAESYPNDGYDRKLRHRMRANRAVPIILANELTFP